MAKGASDDDVQELRIALVMNGGVSLAVWMGGVTLELDRVRRADGVYQGLLDLTRTKARIDVIAGASAGGINGAVLALAIARNSTVTEIRRLWMSEGDIEKLMRDPMQRDAPSLLKGDEQLLRKLNKAMRDIASQGRPVAAEASDPLHLSITGTIIEGEVKSYPDEFGSSIPDVTHRALFQFRRSRDHDLEDSGGHDDFAADPDGHDRLAARLALAARSSASFPGAFEPSRVTIGSERDEFHPDMKPVADFTSDRWVIDGGVLVNTPVQAALDAIKALPAERSVRRVLGYVVPNPRPASPVAKPDGAPPPGAAAVLLDAVSRLPRVQSVASELQEIEQGNRRARNRREARDRTLDTLDAQALKTMATQLLPAYRLARRTAAADDIVEAMLGAGDVEQSASDVEQFATAGQLAHLRNRLASLEEVPWLQPEDEATNIDDASVEPWSWGLAPLENAANVALDLLRRMTRAGFEESELQQLREATHNALHKLRSLERASDAHWKEVAAGLIQASEAQDDERLLKLVNRWTSDGIDEVAGNLSLVVRSAALLVRARAATLGDVASLSSTFGSLDGTLKAETLRRLLALHIVQRASGAELAGIDQEVELVLMSADAPNAFLAGLEAEGKLAGLQVGHFGAFYKSSWRANDWMWGRLDGADRLVRTLLDPRRIQDRLKADGRDTLVDEIRRLACECEQSGASEWLTAQWLEHDDEQLVGDELKALEKLKGQPQLTDLKASYEAIRRRAQLGIVLEEIACVAEAAMADRRAGAAPGSPGCDWAERHFPPSRELDVKALVTAFEECEIGQEKIVQELGSDRFTKVITGGVAVAGSVLGGALPRVKLLAPARAAIRGLLLMLYLLGRGVTEKSRTANFVSGLVLAVGGALVAIYLIGTRVPGLLLLLGVSVLIAGAMLAVLRSKLLRLTLFAFTFFGSAGGYYGVRLWHSRPLWVDPLSAAAAIVLMAGAAMLLGWRDRSAEEQPGVELI